jgi:stress-induced morphogen
MAMDADEIKRRICANLPDAVVEITDLAGDGNHYSAVVKSAAFAGKSRVQQHKLVYNAIGDDMGEGLHALALQTETL